MRILVIGSGAREHAIVQKLAESPCAPELFCAPGNAGIAQLAQLIPISAENGEQLAEFAAAERIDLTVIGPDGALMAGVADSFAARGLKVFGPTRKAAWVEGSKAYAKQLMQAAGIPTAAYRVFTESEEALRYLQTAPIPAVIKADGLAAGKGVVVARTLEEAQQAIRMMMDERVFGASGDQVVIEEFLSGQEASVMAFVDGLTVKMMVPAQDHKPLLDGDLGPNTGGMGTYSPVPQVDAKLLEDIERTIVSPMAGALAQAGTPFSGVLYAGLMLTEQGPKVIEFNARFGDPETQVVLSRLETDLVEICMAVSEHRLDEVELKWRSEAAVCVVLAAPGYPGAPVSGSRIEGVPVVKSEDAKRLPIEDSARIFHAGTKLAEDGQCYLTAGGRVLGVTALGSTLEQAVERAYSRVQEIHFPGMHYRTDIAAKAGLNRS